MGETKMKSTVFRMPLASSASVPDLPITAPRAPPGAAQGPGQALRKMKYTAPTMHSAAQR